jgi:membrane-bound lytic murein transglycosylase MltF
VHRVVTMLVALFSAVVLLGGCSSEEPPPAQDDRHSFISFVDEFWTGDLDGIRERRMLRALVVYSKTHFFIDKGTPRGLSYDGLMALEEALNRRLQTDKRTYIRIVCVPVHHDELIPALLDGRGDLAAANLTITAARQNLVDFSDPVIKNVRELVVTASGVEDITCVEDLAGQQIVVRPASSYHEHLVELNREFKKKGLKPVQFVATPAQLETEDLLEMVNAGLIPITIADSHLAAFWKQVFTDITVHYDVVINNGGSIALAFRKTSPRLRMLVNECLADRDTSFTLSVLLHNYLKSTRWVKNAASEQAMQKFRQTVDVFKKYADLYQFDYLLLTAQGYQESGLNQSARSPAGAVGIMQVMPETGRELGVGNIELLEPNIHAGTKYLRMLKDRYFSDPAIDDLNSRLFAFAAYNAGPARIARLRRTAAERGYDPNVWFDNVEHIVAERVGQEPVRYVSNIFKYYVAYKLAAAKLAEVGAVKNAVKEGLPLEAEKAQKEGFFKRFFKGLSAM